MSNYLGMEKRQIIQNLTKLGWSARKIHRETSIHRETIKKYRDSFQTVPEVPADKTDEKGQSVPKVPTDSPPFTHSQNVFPHLEYIQKRVLELRLSAQRIYQDLVEECGYHGSYDSVKRYVRKFRKRCPQHFERLPVYPGHEAQVDFGKGPKVWDGDKLRSTWFFKITLSFSRHSYEELVFRQDVETFLRCHENAFRSFGGVPASIKLDNLKSGVLKANLYEPTINPLYLAFADYWGFAPNPCAPYHPEQKGRVEKDVGYTKNNALKGREFRSLAEGNQLLRHWNKRWARTRIHGTTKRQVWPVFREFEQPALKSLREHAFSFFKLGRRKVDVHGCIEVQGSYYSVPHGYIGQYIDVQFNARMVKVLINGQLLTQHRSAQRKGSVVSLMEHRPSHKPVNQEQEENWQLIRAKTIGPSCYQLIYKMLAQDDIRGIHRVRGVMSLARQYTREALNEACAIALSQYSYRYQSVKNYCEKIKRKEHVPSNELLQEHDLIRELSEYQAIIN